jgi:hypothetical protein
MLCDWTEKVSLLVDGELPRAEAASVEAHLAGCGECRAARGEFLFFREQLGSYRAEVNTAAQRRALEAILGTAAPEARRGGLLAALGLWPLRPATAGALAFVLLAAVGLTSYLNRRQAESKEFARTPDTRPVEPTATPTPAPTPSTPVEVRENLPPQPKQAVRRPAPPAVAKAGRPRVVVPRPATAEGGPLETAAAEPAGRREPPRDGLDTSRHVEQAQLLLRSFRNARAGDDLAYERERSERLLYRNIVLRREAAKNNDPLLVSVLGRLEPILLDIANLPARPAPDDVASIRERVRKQNLVVVLQAGVEKQ